MRIALDGFPLSSQKTGIGHYTLQLARALAEISPGDNFELISPFPFCDSVVQELQQASLANLTLNYPDAASFRRRAPRPTLHPLLPPTTPPPSPPHHRRHLPPHPPPHAQPPTAAAPHPPSPNDNRALPT